MVYYNSEFAIGDDVITTVKKSGGPERSEIAQNQIVKVIGIHIDLAGLTEESGITTTYICGDAYCNFSYKANEIQKVEIRRRKLGE